MSHFTCLVIGDNPEQLLAPFHEFECTGLDDQYVQNVNRSEEVREWLKENPNATMEEVVSEFSSEKEKIVGDALPSFTHKYGWIRFSTTGEFVEWINRTNPNKKWDWYKLGGRWSDYFLLKDGTRSDSCRIKDIDLVRMRREEEAEAGKKHDEFMTAIADTTWPLTWKECREGNSNIEVARLLYNDQPAVKAAKKMEGFYMGCRFEDYGKDREAYVAKKSASYLSTFSVIKDGKWYQRGEMGWWGCVSNEKEQNQWENEFVKLLEVCDPETRVSLYDCHI